MVQSTYERTTAAAAAHSFTHGQQQQGYYYNSQYGNLQFWGSLYYKMDINIEEIGDSAGVNFN